MNPRLFPALLAGALASLIALTLWAHAETTYRRVSLPPEEDLLYLPRADVLRAGSLGHTELLADLVWVRTVIYAGEEIGHRGRMRWLDRYLDTIVLLDPVFKRPYKWAGVVTMYNGRVITNEMVRASNHYLELGEKLFPDDWEFPFMLGCNYWNELHTENPEQRNEWRRIGAEHIRHAALLQGAPSWLPVVAASFLTREGQNDLAIRHLEEVYASTEDPKIREQIRNKLIHLQATSQAEHIEQARKAIDEGLKQWAPYAPADFYIMVGPPHPDATLGQLLAQPLAEDSPGGK
jgi:hypothetical protein